MRKLIWVLALAVSMATLSGCITFDAQHNRYQWRIIKKDIREIHQDIDFILGLEEESPLVDSHFR